MPFISPRKHKSEQLHLKTQHLSKTLLSLFNQSIPNWDLTLVTNKKYLPQITKLLESAESRHSKIFAHKIRVLISDTTNIATALNEASIKTKGEFLSIIHPGDTLSPHATFEILRHFSLNPKSVMVYTDSDQIDIFDERQNPHFKPPFSPDLLYSKNYVGNLSCIKRYALKKLGGWSSKSSTAYDYDLYLKIFHQSITNSKNCAVGHIPKILYHEKIDHSIIPPSDNESLKKDQFKVLLEFHKSAGNLVLVENIEKVPFRTIWKIKSPMPLVSLIIPTRDGGDVLKRCIRSIIKKTSYKNYEIIIIDNQSSDKKTLDFLNRISKGKSNISIVKYDRPFNYSAMNNFVARLAKGKILGFINDDTEVISSFWLDHMVGVSLRKEVGCVGAMLYYPDKTIQHAGVIVGMHGVADHAYKGLKNSEENDYLDHLKTSRNPLAVTAAVMIVKKDIFLASGGFDEKYFKVAFNDVDLCLRLRHQGYFHVWLSHVELFHHESKTRSKNNHMHNIEEINHFKRKYSNYSLINEQHIPFGLHGKI